MISEDKLREIKRYLDESENPLFFFDDDNDGMCSYLLLKKYLGKGKGICVRGNPILSSEFLRYVDENMPDKIFVLDKPIIDEEFIDRVNVPIVWIDHHTPIKREKVKYYNPRVENEKDSRSVVYWVQKITNMKEDLWIAGVGCISDCMIPDFFDELKKEYPDLFDGDQNAKEILYETKFGELCRIMSFLLKGKVSIVNNSVNLLAKIKDPYELLNQSTKEAKLLAKRTEPIKKEYGNLLKNALKPGIKGKEKLLLFKYRAHRYSLTSELANELIYKNPDKIVIVAREKDDRIKMAIRSTKVDLRPIVEKALVGADGYGGGHEFACASNINIDDFDRFIDVFRTYIH